MSCNCRLLSFSEIYGEELVLTVTLTICANKKREKICFPSAVAPECASYITLNASDRNVRYKGRAKCDNNLETKWYRFQGQAGKKLTTTCPQIHRCNTDIPGWMNGKHPTVEDGKVQRQVCFHGYEKCCFRSTTIDVRNCGAYFVYRLNKLSYCNSRYCGTG